MSRSFDPDDPAAIGDVFAADLRSAYPEAGVPARTADDHVAAMMAAARILAEGRAPAPDPASHPSRPDGWLTIPRRRSMRGRMVRRVVAVAAGLLLSFGGLAIAGAFQGSDDPGDDDQAIVADLPDDDTDVADDQGEDADDQGEDADDQGDNDQGEDADDQGEDGDDQGEDGDDQGEDGDDQGEDGDDQGEDGDDEGEDGDDEGEDENENDGQDDEGDESDDGDSDDGDDEVDDDGGDSDD